MVVVVAAAVVVLSAVVVAAAGFSESRPIYMVCSRRRELFACLYTVCGSGDNCITIDPAVRIFNKL